MRPTILQRYVLRELLCVALLAVLALTSMIFIGMAVSLVQAGLSVVQLRSVAPYVLGFSLPYALPCAFLVASVFVFGRLSGQNEISAMRGSGVNLNHITFPPLLLALLASVGTFGINHYVLPWSQSRVRTLRVKLLNEVVLTAGSANRPYEIGRYCIYLGGLDESRRFWKDVAVVEFAGDFPARVIIAERGRCDVDEDQSIARLLLYDGFVLQPQLQGLDQEAAVKFGRFAYEIDLARELKLHSDRPKYLPLPDLLDALRELRAEAREIRALPEYAALAHPKSERKAAEQEANKAYRNYSRLREDALHWAGQVEAIQKILERCEEEYRSIKAAHESAQNQRDEAEKRVADLRPQRAEVQARLEKLQAAGADASKIEALETEASALDKRIEALSARGSEAEGKLTGLDQDLEGAGSQLRQQQNQRASALSELTSSRAEAEAAWEYFRTKQARTAKIRTLEQLLRAETAFHFRNAGAATCLIFTLIGIPLGILSKRGNVLMAFVLSFFAVLIVYYPFMAVGRMLSDDGHLAPWIAQWMPNVVLGSVGVGLVGWGIRR